MNESLELDLIDIISKLEIKKTIYNKFGDFYYRNAEIMLRKVEPFLTEKKILLNITEELVEKGRFIFLKSTATLKRGDEKISSCAFARIDDDKKKLSGAQISGLTSSYAKKYALQNLFCIDDGMDDDNDKISNPQNTNYNSNKKKVKSTLSGTELTEMEAEVKRLKLYLDDKMNKMNDNQRQQYLSLKKGLSSGKPINNTLIGILNELKDAVEIPF